MVLGLCCELFGDLTEITPLLVFKCHRGCRLKLACGFVIVGVVAPSEGLAGPVVFTGTLRVGDLVGSKHNENSSLR